MSSKKNLDVHLKLIRKSSKDVKKAIESENNLAAMQIFKSKTLNSVQVSYETVCWTLNHLDLRSFSAPFKFFFGGQSGMQ